jgi:hypothetical protein
MPHQESSYFQATRHPWSCLLFLVPLLLLYEAGVLGLGGGQAESLRNGADAWVRWGLESFGLAQFYWAPIFIIGTLLLWSLARMGDRPSDFVGVWIGMALESVVLALGLWLLSRQLGPLLEQWGIRLNWGPDRQALGRVVTYVGAGIYEELLFRLLLFLVLGLFFRLLGVPRLIAPLLTTLASAGLFAAAHHIGPYGEAFDSYVFVFRALAGLYFALIYLLRGFGIAVGAHACYDVLVGVLIP